MIFINCHKELLLSRCFRNHATKIIPPLLSMYLFTGLLSLSVTLTQLFCLYLLPLSINHTSIFNVVCQISGRKITQLLEYYFGLCLEAVYNSLCLEAVYNSLCLEVVYNSLCLEAVYNSLCLDLDQGHVNCYI